MLIAANIDMLLNVYEACTTAGVSRLIFASSNHVMSGYRDTAIPVLRSDTPPNPGNPYGASGSKWDLGEAKEQVGYQPVDNAYDAQWR